MMGDFGVGDGLIEEDFGVGNGLIEGDFGVAVGSTSTPWTFLASTLWKFFVGHFGFSVVSMKGNFGISVSMKGNFGVSVSISMVGNFHLQVRSSKTAATEGFKVMVKSSAIILR